MVTIVTGPQRSGKTSLVRALAEEAGAGVPGGCAGFVSLAVGESHERAGYDAFCLLRERRVPLLREAPRVEGGPTSEAVGRFRAIPGSFARLNRWAQDALDSGCRILVIDEIGRLELGGGGWAPALRAAVARTPRPHLLVGVRDSCRAEACALFGLDRPRVIELPHVLAAALERVYALGAADPADLGRLVGSGIRAGRVLGTLLCAQGRLREEDGAFVPATVSPERNLSPLGRRLAVLLRDSGARGLDPRKAVGPSGGDEGLRFVRLGLAVRLGRRLLDPEACASLVRRLAADLGEGRRFGLGDVRRSTLLTRTEVLDLVEILELAGVVRHAGDVRELVGLPAAAQIVTAARRLLPHGGSPGDRRRRRARR